MNHLVYKPNVYEGKDPYIHVSFHQNDRVKVLNILEKLNMRGVRFWMDDGITPGMETDEIIATHIENSDFFVAFLSSKYLNFLDTVDELNYSRDVNKEYLLIYLEDVALPYGLDMRFMRAQSVKAYAMSDNDVYTQLMNIDGIKRFYGIAQEDLRLKAERVFDKLEKLYPEHKVFALDAVGKQLSKEISELYVKAGYPSAERLMMDYGFETISTKDARILRSSVLYQPGYEPDYIKPRIDYIMDTLTSEYPDKKIMSLLSNSHKSIYNSLMGLCIWLGYETVADMLNAYGFTGIAATVGRNENDHEAVLEELTKRYRFKEKPTSVTQLMIENPDMKGNLKTLANRASEKLGMTLFQYLKKVGLLVGRDKEEQTTLTSINRKQIIQEIQGYYYSDEIDCGNFSDVEDTLNHLVIKRNKKNLVYVSDCSYCNETMNIPYGIDFIDKEAFTGQSDLVHLVLPASVKEIKEGAFSDCDGLETIVLPEGLEVIGNQAFAGCSSLKNVIFPKSLRTIGNRAFAGCDALEEVEFNSSRVSVREDAFEDCDCEIKGLQVEGASDASNFELKVDKKNNAKIVAYTGDEEVVMIPGSIDGHPIVSIEKGSFKGNDYIKEVYMSDEIGALNGDVFKDCKNLTKVHISETVSSITATTFAGCSNLTEVNIPNSMVEVQRGLFKDAPLTTLYIGKDTAKISTDAFYKGDADFASGMYFKKKSLHTLVVDARNEHFSAEGTLLLSSDRKVVIAELGDPVKVVIPEGVEEIATGAFDRLSSLCEVVLPSTLKKIGEKAFASTNLKAIELPVNVEVIETQAFSFCRTLTDVDLNANLRIIGPQAFEGCPIKDVYIPISVESIGNNSFLAISTYQGQTPQRFRVDMANEHLVADGVCLYQKMEDKVVLIKCYHPDFRTTPMENKEPMEYTIMEGTTVIGEHAFARCNNMSAITIVESVQSISDMAFWDCSKLTSVRLPEGCAVSPKAFFGIVVNFV